MAFYTQSLGRTPRRKSCIHQERWLASGYIESEDWKRCERGGYGAQILHYLVHYDCKTRCRIGATSSSATSWERHEEMSPETENHLRKKSPDPGETGQWNLWTSCRPLPWGRRKEMTMPKRKFRSAERKILPGSLPSGAEMGKKIF